MQPKGMPGHVLALFPDVFLDNLRTFTLHPKVLLERAPPVVEAILRSAQKPDRTVLSLSSSFAGRGLTGGKWCDSLRKNVLYFEGFRSFCG